MPDPIYLIYGALFVGAVLLVEGLFYVYVDKVAGERQLNRRMRMLSSGKSGRDVYWTLRRRPAGADLPGALGHLYGAVDRQIAAAGITIPTGRLLLLFALLGGLAFAAILVLGQAGVLPPGFGGPLSAAAAAVLAGVVLPWVRIAAMKAARTQRFAAQLPDALDVMVRSLSSGHPVSAAVGLVSREMPDPIGTEFGLAADEMTYGLALHEALENMARRVALSEFKYVVVAINIQHETGGNLAEILHGLATVMRARFRMYRKIRALSAEGRLSMKVLAVLPIVFAGLAFLTQPHFYLDVMDDPIFLPIVGVAVVLEVFGILIMQKMVNFRV